MESAEAVDPDPESPKRGVLLAIFQALVAVTVTIGYVRIILPKYPWGPAWPLNAGCLMLLGLLWWLALRGGRGLAKPGLAIGLIGFGLMVVGHRQMMHAEAELRAELVGLQVRRLALEPGKGFNERDALVMELVKVFGRHAFENPPVNVVGLEPNPAAYAAMVQRLEERTPGWEQILYAFIRANVLKDVSFQGPYWGKCVVIARRDWSLTSYNQLLGQLKEERSVRQRVETDRETFLKAWKNRPVER